jgi:hypothetical protein
MLSLVPFQCSCDPACLLSPARSFWFCGAHSGSQTHNLFARSDDTCPLQWAGAAMEVHLAVTQTLTLARRCQRSRTPVIIPNRATIVRTCILLTLCAGAFGMTSGGPGSSSPSESRFLHVINTQQESRLHIIWSLANTR